MIEMLKKSISDTHGDVLTDTARLRAYMSDILVRDQVKLETMSAIIDSGALEKLYAHRGQSDSQEIAWNEMENLKDKLTPPQVIALQSCFVFWYNLINDTNLAFLPCPRKVRAQKAVKQVYIPKKQSIDVQLKHPKDGEVVHIRVDTSKHHDIVLRVLMLFFLVLSFSSCSYYDSQYHRFLSNPWSEQFYPLQRDWQMLTLSDSAWAAQECPEAEVYTDAKGTTIRHYGEGQYCSGYGKPIAVNGYRYIGSDHLVHFHWVKLLVDIVWYFCVYLSLPLIIVSITPKLIHLLKRPVFHS